SVSRGERLVVGAGGGTVRGRCDWRLGLRRARRRSFSQPPGVREPAKSGNVQRQSTRRSPRIPRVFSAVSGLVRIRSSTVTDHSFLLVYLTRGRRMVPCRAKPDALQ